MEDVIHSNQEDKNQEERLGIEFEDKNSSSQFALIEESISEENGQCNNDEGCPVEEFKPGKATTSTPDKLTTSPAIKTAEYVRNTKSSYEYTYFVIASPQIKRKLDERSSSFASLSSSQDTGLSTPPPPAVKRYDAKLTRKTKSVLETVKKRLMCEIAKIDHEIAKMDAQKSILLNLRNTIINSRDEIRKAERNKQSVPTAENFRQIAQTVLKNMRNENDALHDGDIRIPHFDDLMVDLHELMRVCNMVIENKTNLQVECAEEMYAIVGKLFGMVESVMLIFYDDETDDIIDGNEWGNGRFESTRLCESQLNHFSCSPDDSTDKIYPDDENLDANKETVKASENIDKRRLKTFVKRIGKMKRCLNGVDRLSSGAPKIKTLTQCFHQMTLLLGDQCVHETRTETVFQELAENVGKLKQVLNTERPGERELEKCKFEIGELCGRMKILLKNDFV